MSQNAMDWFKIWIEEIRSPHPDVARATASAHQLVSLIDNAPSLRLLAEALGGTVEDDIDCDACQAQLTDFIHAQTGQASGAEASRAHFAAVQNHLALCPHCMAAYAQVSEWVLASQADAIPVAKTYPTFDLAFLAEDQPAPQLEPTDFAWPTALIEDALAEGKRWLADIQGGLYLLFGPSLPAPAAAGWALKSGAPGQLLAQLVVGETEIDGWEIEVTAFANGEGDGDKAAEEATTCRVEVALYPLDLPATRAAAIPVSLHYAAVTQTQITDDGGVAQFTAIPIDQLPQLVIRIKFD